MTSIRTLQVGDRTLDVAFRFQPRLPAGPYEPPTPEGYEIEAVWEGMERADTTKDEEAEIVKRLKEIARDYR